MTFMRVLLESKWSHWTGTNTVISAYPKPNHGTVEHDDNMVWWSVVICAIVSHNVCELTSSISTGDWSHSEVRLENHSQPFLHAWLFHALASKKTLKMQKWDAGMMHFNCIGHMLQRCIKIELSSHDASKTKTSILFFSSLCNSYRKLLTHEILLRDA